MTEESHESWLAREAARAYALGEPRGAVEPVTGGLAHLMWRLETDRGRFAVKEINRDFDRRGYMEHYERACAFEVRACEAGIPVPRPIPLAGGHGYFAEIPRVGQPPVTLRVHEWSDARPYDATRDDDAALAAQVGAIIARTHALNVPASDPIDDRLTLRGETYWREMLARLRAASIAWADDLETAIDPILELERILTAAREDDGTPTIMGHRDAYAGNVLIDADGRVLLIDWDAAASVTPQRDVAKHALEWAEYQRDEPDQAVLRAFIGGYRGAGGVLAPPRPEDAAEFYDAMLSWMAFNLRRALGERRRNDADAVVAEREARRVLQMAHRYVRYGEDWAAALA
jgi:aminoglycoside phosphotransferase (APT) family kinase protein